MIWVATVAGYSGGRGIPGPPQDPAHTTVAGKGREQQRRRLRRRPPGAAAPGGVVVPGLFPATVVCTRSWGVDGIPRPPLYPETVASGIMGAKVGGWLKRLSMIPPNYSELPNKRSV